MSLIALACIVGGVFAAAPLADPQVARLTALVDQSEARLRDLAAGLRLDPISDNDLKVRRAAIDPVRADLNAAVDGLMPRLADAEAQLRQLQGRPTGSLQNEPAATEASRRALKQASVTAGDQIRRARLLQVEADQIRRGLTQRLEEKFAARLWSHGRSILDPSLWSAFAQAVPERSSLTRDVLANEAGRFITALGGGVGRLLVGIGLPLALVVALGLPLWLRRWAFRRAAIRGATTDLSRALLAVALTLTGSLPPFAAALIVYAALVGAGALSPLFAELGMLGVRITLFTTFVGSLGHALLSPARPDWRLAPIQGALAARLAPYPALIGLAAAAAAALRALETTLGAEPAAQTLGAALAVLLQIAALGGALLTVARARTASSHPLERSTGPWPVSRSTWVLATIAAWSAILVALGALLVGYVAFSRFLIGETIWIGIVLAVLFLLLKLTDELWPELLGPEGQLGRPLRRAVGLSSRALEQLGVLVAGLFRLGLLLLGWTAVVAPFGADPGDIVGRVISNQIVLRLGQVSVSPGSILTAVVVFLAALFATRAVRRWLETRYFPKSDLDPTQRAAAGAGVTYAGVLIALGLTVANLGFSLGQMALLASALSVGIGFGLQAIIGNFVAGLILMIERPVRIGDWIAIGELEGDVRKINIRATEIELADRSLLVVPNTEFISKSVRNVTHDGAMGRVRILLKVTDTAAPDQVREAILGVVAGHPSVRQLPEPGVFLSEIRDGALEFVILAFVSSPREAFGVRSDLLVSLVTALRTQGISLGQSPGWPAFAVAPTPATN